jgi:hypothetical protein
MLDWLTFAAALLAAIGAAVGPIIAYRASIKTIETNRQTDAAVAALAARAGILSARLACKAFSG